MGDNPSSTRATAAISAQAAAARAAVANATDAMHAAERDYARAIADVQNAASALAKIRAQGRLAFVRGEHDRVVEAVYRAYLADELAAAADRAAAGRTALRRVVAPVRVRLTPAEPASSAPKRAQDATAAAAAAAEEAAYFAPENAEARMANAAAAAIARARTLAARTAGGAPPDWRDTGKE